MTDSKTLKLLLVEDDLQDEHLISEALIEIEETRLWSNWRNSSIVQVEQLTDALDCLGQEAFDAILLNLSLPDSPALLDTFVEVYAAANGAPIVVLADEDDTNLANRLLREGAQDVLLKSELECVPMARSVRYAIERQRRAQTQGSSAFSDPLTGALTRQAFLTIAERAAQLASSKSTILLLGFLEISPLAHNNLNEREACDILLIRAVDSLRARFQPPSMIGRIGRGCFAIVTAGLTETILEAMLNRAALEIEAAAPEMDGQAPGVPFSVAELEPDCNLEELLADNAAAFAENTHRRAKTAMLAD